LKTVKSARAFSPAKLNLFLAVTGRRPDGYHDLVSLATPLAWGDDLLAEETGGGFALECGDPGVPRDGTNLVFRAAEAFRAASGWRCGVRFILHKRIPVGAGLGGGSSNAVAALRALNELAGGPLDETGLLEIAAGLGSDCPLFLNGGPVVLRGRGERIEPLPDKSAMRLRGRRVLLFKPGFEISTAGAYARLAEREGGAYLPPAEAERSLGCWLADSSAAAEEILFNSFERPAFERFPALPVLLDRIRIRFGLVPHMSGSGSACFALLPPAGGPAPHEIGAFVRDAWGPSALFVETRIA
jgi:4-diphosphocytidyl-2-C-methyl-D-erythritol kinase